VTQAVVYVQFVLDAPGAVSVAVSGDFNEWDRGAHRLDDPDGDGVWTGRVPVRPGIHEYMFVIDGERWVTDPGAQRYADDGFGNRNAVLAVPEPDRT
jgi:1,4-alpha-glucan branching enzyme